MKENPEAPSIGPHSGHVSRSIDVATERTEHDRLDNQAHLPHGIHLVVIFASLVLSILLVALDFTIIATAIPRITDEFHSLDQVGWYGSAYFLTNSAFQSCWGKAYTYCDLKRTFVFGISLFEIGTLVCATAPSSTVFILGRAFAGFGGAALGTGAFTIVAAIAPPRKRAMYIGFMGATYGIASVIGPILGGIFTEYVTWRWCFWINLPIGGLASSMVLFFFKAPPRHVPAATKLEQFLQMDLVGASPLLGSLVCYLMAMRWGGVTFSWTSGPVLGTLITFVALAVVFVAIEWRSKSWAMMQVRFFKQSEIVLNLVYMYFLSGLYMPAIYFLSIQFQAIGNASPAQAGIQLIPLALCVSIGTIVANTCITKFGHSGIWLVSGPLLALVGSVPVYAFGSRASKGDWIGFQIVLGFGIGFALQTPISINQSLVEANDIAIIISMTLFFEEMGSCMMVSAAQSAFSNKLVSTLASGDSGIDPLTVINAGASQLRSLFQAQDLHAILEAYQEGLNVTYALFLACGAVTTAVSLVIVGQEMRRNSEHQEKQDADRNKIRDDSEKEKL